MMKEKKFYKCNSCGNIVELVENGGGELVCCGKPMKELVANTTDAATEKHVPVVEIEDGKAIVKVGSVDHPMTPEHYIQWIYLVAGNKSQRVDLTPDDSPEAVFYVGDEKVNAVYEYCNLHGLWVTILEEEEEGEDDLVCSPEFPEGCM